MRTSSHGTTELRWMICNRQNAARKIDVSATEPVAAMKGGKCRPKTGNSLKSVKKTIDARNNGAASLTDGNRLEQSPFKTSHIGELVS